MQTAPPQQPLIIAIHSSLSVFRVLSMESCQLWQKIVTIKHLKAWDEIYRRWSSTHRIGNGKNETFKSTQEQQWYLSLKSLNISGFCQPGACSMSNWQATSVRRRAMDQSRNHSNSVSSSRFLSQASPDVFFRQSDRKGTDVFLVRPSWVRLVRPCVTCVAKW